MFQLFMWFFYSTFICLIYSHYPHSTIIRFLKNSFICLCNLFLYKIIILIKTLIFNLLFISSSSSLFLRLSLVLTMISAKDNLSQQSLQVESATIYFVVIITISLFPFCSTLSSHLFIPYLFPLTLNLPLRKALFVYM